MFNKTPIRKRFASGALLTSGVAVAAVLLAGCGGDKTNGNTFGTIPDTTPAVYGLDPFLYTQGTYGMASSLASPDGTTVYATEATASSAAIASALEVTPISGGAATLPLGFSPGGQTITGSKFATAVAPGTSVVFRAALANGVKSGQNVYIDSSSVVLTTPEIAGFSQQLTFNNPNGGVLPSATYTTGSFALPFTTTGIHTVHVTIGDLDGRSSSTDFGVVVLKPTDSAVLAQVTDSKGNPLTNATVTITNPVSGFSGTTKSDLQGVAVLFAAPGTQTVTVTSSDGTITFSASVTLTAGVLLDSDTTAKNPLVLSAS